MINMKKSIGSALLITILIIGTVGAIALALGRLTLSEIKISSSLSDSVISYFAAEGGLEDGLWRYRVNHEIEDPCTKPERSVAGKLMFENMCNEDITEANTTNIDRYNYDTSIFDHNITPAATSADQRVYDLKVYFKQPDCIGFKEDCITIDQDNYAYRLIPDQSKTFDVTNLQGKSIDLRVVKNNLSWSVNYWIEYKIYSNTEPNPTIDIKTYPNDNTGTPLASPPVISIIIPTVPADKFVKLTIKFLTQSDKSGSFNFGLNSSPGENIDTGFTYIDSTGYYGSTKRRLRMTIDRESGNIISLLDYALYAGGGPITP